MTMETAIKPLHEKTAWEVLGGDIETVGLLRLWQAAKVRACTDMFIRNDSALMIKCGSKGRYCPSCRDRMRDFGLSEEDLKGDDG